jgi:hypothetical protein
MVFMSDDSLDGASVLAGKASHELHEVYESDERFVPMGEISGD